ncbi:hypothetical protein [Saccharicrinis sp. FJH54]|uniref:hypothetical protein n=1 Tax=Saccharicrinis sp. FJH54 TaxID=3344665 RepID=UPI0035D50E78
MMQKLKLLLIGLVLIQLSFAENTEVSIVPFTISQNGQIIITACINNKSFPAKFYIETNGQNLLRSDQSDRLRLVYINPDNEITTIDSVMIGTTLFKNSEFRIASKLEKRGIYAFPDSILGTLGPEIFENRILQIDFKAKVLKITDKVKLLQIPDSAFKMSFRDDRQTTGINLELQTEDFGTHDVAVDTRSPLGIHLYYSDLSSSQKKKHKDEFRHSAVKLDGIHNKTFVFFEPEPMSINKTIQINGQPVWLSDFIPNSIGNEFLNRFRVTIDFREHILYLEPVSIKGKQMLTPL